MPFTIRPATFDDNRALFGVFREAVVDLGQRIGATAITASDRDATTVDQLWQRRRPLVEHLARTAESGWLAEQDGQIVGYARSILRDGVRQLTEFFVLPAYQSGGIGTQLLRRAFPAEGANRRIIIASPDIRAISRYLKLGLYPRFPIYEFGREPEDVRVETDLTIEPLSPAPGIIDTLGALDMNVLGYRRDMDHQWLIDNRSGFLYSRAGQPVGYGYRRGPVALLDENDFPAVLLHAEREAFRQGREFALELPLINRRAVDHLLSRGCKMDPFFEYFMTDDTSGHFERYIVFSPAYFT